MRVLRCILVGKWAIIPWCGLCGRFRLFIYRYPNPALWCALCCTGTHDLETATPPTGTVQQQQHDTDKNDTK